MKQVYYSLRDLPKEHLFRKRSLRLKNRIILLLQEKHQLEDQLDYLNKNQDKLKSNDGIRLQIQDVERNIITLEIREDRLFRELERLTLLTERADSTMWRWLMFVFALTNFLITIMNFRIHQR